MKLTPAAPVAAAVLAIVSLVACTTGSAGGRSSGSSSVSSTPPPEPSVSPSSTAAAPSPSPSSAGLQVGRIGTTQGVSLPDGVQVSVPKEEKHAVPKSVQSGAGVERTGDTLAIFTVVVKNGGTRPIDASLMAVNLIANGEQATGLNYSEYPTNPPAGTILPGKSGTGTFGFLIRSRTDPGHMQIEVYPTQAEPHAILTDNDGTT